MITWYCTRKLIRSLEVEAAEPRGPGTTTLGDWHANIISTRAGDLFAFSNDRTLVSVAIPVSHRAQIESLFVARVRNLLMMLDAPQHAIELETNDILPVVYARATDQRQLGYLRDIAFEYQYLAENRDGGTAFSLSDVELHLANMPHHSGFDGFPADKVATLFNSGWN